MAGARFGSPDYICTTGSIPRLSLEAVFSRGGRPLRVPLLQRRYCWAAPQLASFLRDALTQARGERGCLSADGDGGHSFGRIVVSATGTVLDGQQRLTSAMLLVSAVRDCLEDNAAAAAAAAAAPASASDAATVEDAEEAARCVQQINSFLFPWGAPPTAAELAAGGGGAAAAAAAAALL